MPNPLVGTAITSGKRVEDLLLWEVEQRYCRTAVDLPAGTYQIGQVLLNEVQAVGYAIGAQPTFSDVLCLENITVPAGKTYAVNALVRGPALVNLDEVVRTSGSETDAALITRLADLLAQGVRFVREPLVQSTTNFNM